jgi:hypothetical protein
MTHLDETIRASSLQFLDLWIQLAPEFVVAQRHSVSNVPTSGPVC